MPNNYYRLSEGQLQAFGVLFSTTATASPGTYSLLPADVLLINNAANGFIAARTDADAKEAAFRAAVQTKQAARQTLIDTVASSAARFYANPAIDDTELAAIGLQPRDTTRTPVTPKTPLEFTASPNVDGSVRLKWLRNGNPYGVTFVVEARQGGTGAWQSVSITRRQSLTLNGFEPGEYVEFRVFAKNGEEESTPSNVAVIYGPGGLAELTIAA
jgi:hypothetical protein